MSIPILIKDSSNPSPGERPQVSDLELRELALNSYDGNLFTKKVGIGTTVVLLTPWNENNGQQSIYYNKSVGIGTTNPTSKLTVYGGDIRVGVNTSFGLILTDKNQISWRVGVNTDGTLFTTQLT
tara:strand:+ start:122 stop:496 length:375 start_codon:yes stop_codon:yes gene_type:complete